MGLNYAVGVVGIGFGVKRLSIGNDRVLSFLIEADNVKTLVVMRKIAVSQVDHDSHYQYIILK